MTGRLAGKTAIVTGGNSGIGLATARIFIAEGARVAILGRDSEKLARARESLGESALAFQADVTDLPGLRTALAGAGEALGRVDILFANAGIGGLTPLDTTTPEVFQRTIATDLTAVFFTVQFTLPFLSDGASIIFNGSLISVLGAPGYCAYAAAKAGVASMARVVAAELAPRRIRVNTISPGATRTPIWDRAAPTSEAFKSLEDAMSRTVPLGKIAGAEDIANTALFLASDDAAHVNATEIFVDGGASGARMGAAIYRG